MSAREYVNEETAGLAALDGIGYEGYICASLAFGFYVERGRADPIKIAEWLTESAEEFASDLEGETIIRYRHTYRLQINFPRSMHFWDLHYIIYRYHSEYPVLTGGFSSRLRFIDHKQGSDDLEM